MNQSPGRIRQAWRRWRWHLLVFYLILLAASHAARWLWPAEAQRPGCCTMPVSALAGAERTARTIQFSYLDLPAQSTTDHLPIVLLHGSPGEARNFDRLMALLPGHRRIAPDLPGFGFSTRDIPDYSFRTHARYTIELFDRLGVERAHVVGFSMGGGVALHMAELAPARVASVTMLAAIGVQEMELLGDYHLNHAVHGLQLGLCWALREGLPWTPRSHARDFSVAYSRNFYDSDQRPLRDLLLRYNGPMQIIHGRRDFLVPPEAAIEHHRLVPQSELTLSDDDHFMVFVKPDDLAPLLLDFAARVEAGKAATRASAEPARLAASRAPFDPRHLPKFIGVTAVVVVLLLAAATLVSEDLACIAAGVMAAQGRIGFALATFACFLGIFIGDLLLFLAGRWLGRAALARLPLRWFVKDEDVRRGSEWFSRQGARVIFASRFLPGARLPTYFAAGALRTSFWRFALYFLLACAVWTPILVGLAMLLGREVIESALAGSQSMFVNILVAGIPILILVRLLVRLSTWKGRRLLLSSWRRLTRWEFWPMAVFYPPVVGYILWLAIKHRSLTLFTAANPAIPGGGFIGESKAAILRGLAGAAEFLPWWELIPGRAPGNARGPLQAPANASRVCSQLVLKPDAGQRGAGVAIIRSEAELDAYLQTARGPTLMQEYIEGEEFGVFYYRYPDEARGRIFAITEKRFPWVTGDGRSTLEQLILNDDRAVCIARLLLAAHADRLWEVPPAGARVPLVEVGAHARGALFLDGGWVKTDALEEAIDRICRGYEGFYFGRFDLRAPDVEAFRQGRDFKIIELNGVTSEATSIYDPKNSVFTAWRVLREQWRIAFEIGAQNRRRGVRPASVRSLLRALFDFQAW
jgi:membrane protein DedA with SNARE-associated domain/pimeloyl-ACP methyl ester carboxylesterase